MSIWPEAIASDRRVALSLPLAVCTPYCQSGRVTFSNRRPGSFRPQAQWVAMFMVLSIRETSPWITTSGCFSSCLYACQTSGQTATGIRPHSSSSVMKTALASGR